MSKLEVDAIEPQSGTTLTIGASGDSVNIASGATITDFTSTGIDDNATANALTLDSSGNLQFNSGFGSVATAYGCRAWINFDGTGTIAINDSGNISSISDKGTGTYTINLATGMPDANYSFLFSGRSNNSTGLRMIMPDANDTISSSRIDVRVVNVSDTPQDLSIVTMAIIR